MNVTDDIFKVAAPGDNPRVKKIAPELASVFLAAFPLLGGTAPASFERVMFKNDLGSVAGKYSKEILEAFSVGTFCMKMNVVPADSILVNSNVKETRRLPQNFSDHQFIFVEAPPTNGVV